MATRMATRATQTRRLSRRLLTAMIAAALLLTGVVWARAQAPIAPVQQHAVAVVGAGHLLQQVFGPMPAVAGTPFLGLAVLSGAALFSDTDFVRNSDSPFVRGFHDNALLAEARRYATLPLFLSLIALALLTYMANSGKIRGAVGKMLRAAEDSSVLVTYALLALVTLFGAARAAPAPKVALMGLWSVPTDILVTVGLAMALGVMMTVRFAFDVLIWLSPFPFIDFTFETLKKLLSLTFLALYFLSPVAASSVGLLVLLPALFLYGWALRIFSFAFRIVLRPLFVRLFPESRPAIVDEHLRARFAPSQKDREQITVAVPASALAVRGVRRRAPGAVLRTPEGVFFVTTSWFRRRRVGLHGSLVLGRALLWLELRATHPDGRVERIALPRTYAQDFETLRSLLGAEDGGSLGAVRIFGEMAGAASGS
jgi:hypothetical protein